MKLGPKPKRGFMNNPVATVLTVYGIETYNEEDNTMDMEVATVLTVYGIETVWDID